MIWLNFSVEDLGITLFNCAHFILAVKYHKVATEAPAIIEGRQVKKPSVCRLIAYWFLLISCVLSGLVDGVVSSLFYSQILINENEPSNELTDIKIVTEFWVAFCAVASGIILIAGVIKIRNFFKDKNAIESINTSTLTRHAVAFGLYLVGVVLWVISLAIY